jgi:hypothetical protein
MVSTCRIKHDAAGRELHAGMVHRRLFSVRVEENSVPVLRVGRMTDARQRLPAALQPKSMQVDARQLCPKFTRARDEKFNLCRPHQALMLIRITRMEHHAARHLSPIEAASVCFTVSPASVQCGTFEVARLSLSPPIA